MHREQYNTQYSMYQVSSSFPRVTEPRKQGYKQATGYFKVWNQLYKHSSSGKTPCVSHSGQVTRRKDKFELPMPIMKPYMSEWTRLSAQSRKTGSPRDSEGKCRDTPKYFPTSEGSDPHPQIAGSWGSPPSRPCIRSSGQGSGTPTPREWNLWTHPWRSTVSEMKTHFTNGPWAGFVLIFTKKEKKWGR